MAVGGSAPGNNAGDGGQDSAHEDENGESDCVGGNPISIATGNKYQVETDFMGVGELGLGITRSYNSFSSENGIFGKKWSSNLTSTLTFQASPDEIVKIRTVDGKLITLTKSQDFWYYQNGTPAILNYHTENNSWIYQKDSLTQVFDANGRLVEQTNENGHSLMYEYTNNRLTKVTRNGSSSFTLTYNSYGKVQTIIDPNNQYYSYFYDSARNLIKVRYPGNAYRKYTYQGASRLTGIEDERGEQYASWTYDSIARANASWHGDQQEKFSINSFTSSNGKYYTNTTNAIGKTTQYTFEEIAGKKRITGVLGHAKGTCLSASRSYTYDVHGNKDQVTDWQGEITDYDHDIFGNITKITKAYGASYAQTETREYWNGNSEKPTKIVTPLKEKHFEYDEVGRLTKYTLLNKGRTSNSTANKVWTINYTFFSTGLIKTKTINGPRTDVNDVETYEYDIKGNLIKFTNALGHVTTYSNYDNNGRVRRITQPNGLVTNITYNPRGWVTLRSVTDGSTTRNTNYTYDKTGLMTKVTHADGSYYTFVYDSSQRLIYVNDSNSKYKKYTYDAASNITKEAVIDLVTKQTLVQIAPWPEPDYEVVTTTVAEDIYKESSQYDALSRLTKIIGGNNQTQQFSYRKDNLLAWEKDGLGKQTTYSYDALKRLKWSKDPNGKYTYFYYNAENQLIRVRDPDARNTYYDRDGFGQVWRLRSPDTGYNYFYYDAAGNVTKKIDANAVTTTFTYDVLNRVRVVWAGNHLRDYRYDYNQKGHLWRIYNSSGRSDYYRNKYGELTRRYDLIDTRGHNTYWYYDTMGRTTQIRYPDNRRAYYSYNNTGGISLVRTRLGSGAISTVVSNPIYKPFGPLESYTYGNGETRDYGRDLSYRMSALGSGNNIARNYTIDANNNITSVDDISNTNQDRTYTYDVLQRLKNHTGPDGTYNYTFDNTGNRKTSVRNGVTTTNTYISGTNKLSKSGSTNYTLDAVGNTKQIGSRVFTYNPENRLSRVTHGSTVVDYKYNASGERVYKQKGSVKTYYVYGQGGQLLYEKEGSITKTYIYFGNELVAYVRNNVLYYVHTDHLGRPEVMTNASKTKVWNAQNNAYNRTVTQGASLGFNVGFPGQYWDVDTNLFYNYFRDYDPTIGRYIQSDPIGLAAGINTYTYVSNNPMNLIDPLGLSECDPDKDDFESCVNKCIEDTYGHLGIYQAAQALNPITAFNGAAEVGTRVLDRRLQTRSNRELYGGSSLRNNNYHTGRRMANTLSQFRRFNTGMLYLGAASVGFQAGALINCSLECAIK